MAGGISGDGTSESGILKPTDRRRACRLDRGKGTAICMPADVKWCECTWRKMDENWWWNIKHTINLSDNQIHTTRNKLIFLLLLGSPSNNPVDGGQVQIGDEILEECHHSVATRVDLGTPWFGSSGISQRRNHTTIKGCRIQFTIGLRYCWWKKSAPVLRLLGSFSPLFTRFYTSQWLAVFFASTVCYIWSDVRLWRRCARLAQQLAPMVLGSQSWKSSTATNRQLSISWELKPFRL